MKCRKRKPILFRMQKLEMKIKASEEEISFNRVTNELNTLRSQQQQQLNQVMGQSFELGPAQVQIEPTADSKPSSAEQNAVNYIQKTND